MQVIEQQPRALRVLAYPGVDGVRVDVGCEVQHVVVVPGDAPEVAVGVVAGDGFDSQGFDVLLRLRPAEPGEPMDLIVWSELCRDRATHLPGHSGHEYACPLQHLSSRSPVLVGISAGRVSS